MFDSITRTWSRDAVGYRRGELDDSEAVATTVVTLIGGPTLLVGYLLTQADGLSVFQVLLVAPLAAAIGGMLVGGSARMAAATGANGTWLLHPAFGFGGSWMVSLIRLIMIILWGAVGLRLTGEWLSGAAVSAGATLASPVVAILVLAALGALMTFVGMVTTIKNAIRRPIFWGSVFLVAVLGWELASRGAGFSSEATGPFWLGLERAIEMSAIFIPFFQTVGRRLRTDEDALSSFGVSYTISVTLMVVLGAVLAGLGGGGTNDLMLVQAGSLGLATAIGWVLVTEVDQVFAAFVAAGSESAGIIPVVSPLVIGMLSAGATVVVALVMTESPVGLASLATAVVFPASVIAAADFFVAKGSYYAESDTYGAYAGEDRLNLVGVAMWLLAVILGQALDPIGPEAWVGQAPTTSLNPDMPWRLIMAVVAAIGYVVLSRWREKRAAPVYELRGV